MTTPSFIQDTTGSVHMKCVRLMSYTRILEIRTGPVSVSKYLLLNAKLALSTENTEWQKMLGQLIDVFSMRPVGLLQLMAGRCARWKLLFQTFFLLEKYSIPWD